MWNLFKKSEKEEIKVLIVEDNSTFSGKTNYPKEVLEIHHEFHTAAENLLLEAKQIISEAASKNVSKVSRLELLGFKQAAQVTELKPLQQKAELSKEQLDSLAYYQLHYPNNKFITEEQVKIICHKYNLVCGDVSRFKGFVPEKNLKDIEKFKVKPEDLVKYEIQLGRPSGDLSIYPKNIDKFVRGNSGFVEHNLPQFYNSRIGEFDKVVPKNNSLQICAPIKDMDISDLELKEGYKLTKKHIPDPVVLQPVKNGYLILTAWGDEASDELVVNQKYN